MSPFDAHSHALGNVQQWPSEMAKLWALCSGESWTSPTAMASDEKSRLVRLQKE